MVTKEPKPQPDIAGRPRFESLLSDLTARFANLPPARVGGEITTALRQICEGLQLDRSTLWEFPASDPQVAHSSRGPTTACAASEERLNLAMDSAGAGLWSMDLESQQIWANPRIHELYQFPAEQVPQRCQSMRPNASCSRHGPSLCFYSCSSSDSPTA